MSSRSLTRRLERLENEQRRKADEKRKQSLPDDPWVREAVSDTFRWVTEFTKTYNEHWHEEGRPSPYEPFPREQYFEYLFDAFDLEPIVWIEKSRDLMISWACVAYLTRHAMVVPRRGVLFQTQKKEKVVQLVN